MNRKQFFKRFNNPFVWFILGGIVTFFVTQYFTLYGYDLSFPDYPELQLQYQIKNPIHLTLFNPNNSLLVINYPSQENPDFVKIKVRVINKGRQEIKRLFITIRGEGIHSPTNMGENIKGKNGYIDVELPLIFECNNTQCDLEDIPLGGKLLNMWVWCEECTPNIQNYLLEVCIYDDVNLNQEECIGEQILYI